MYNISTRDNMNKLYEFNKYVLNKYEGLEYKDSLACPLLVSSNPEFEHNLERKIMYIGQENNGWVNYTESGSNYNQQSIEDRYFNFLQNGVASTEFWQFISKVLNVPREELIKKIIWNNTLIAGKRYEAGPPDCDNTLKDLSIENLLFLYEYFNPEYTIFVNGPNNPYYDITYKFLKEIKSRLQDYYPKLDNPMLVDDDKKIIWTYHPNYQKRKSLHKEIIPNIRNIIK